MIRCANCHNEVNTAFPDVQFNDWLKLMHYFEHELKEEEITVATYEDMVDALMSVKPWPKEDYCEEPEEEDESTRD